MPLALAALGRPRFVELTTFRRSGAPVPTPVWVVADGDDLLVLTPAASGKVRRLRRDPRVLLRPCSRRGRVHEHAQTVPGRAQVVEDPAEVERVKALLEERYGAEYRIFMRVERLARRGADTERLVLRIAADTADAQGASPDPR